ncbi:MAG: zinc-ribbon domain-containing protein, partial [Clostridia bacterium]
MAKCANCGEMNPDNASFCLSCGKAMGNQQPSPAEIAMENAKKEFDKDARANLDRSKITYVCELCGTINKIDSPRCVRCGKPRPRSEFIAALKGIKNAREEQVAAPAEEAVAAVVPEPQAPIEEVPEVQEEKQQTVYRYEPAQSAPVQNPQVIQPLVIVPYVNAAEKLWQYNPRQMYRFEPYTEAEKLNAQGGLQENGDKSLDELISLRNQEFKADGQQAQPKVARPKSTKKVRVAAVFSLLFSILFIASLFLVPFSKNSDLLAYAQKFGGLEVFKFLFVCISGAFGIELGITSTFTYNGFVDFLLPVGYWVAGIFALIIAIRS